MGLAFRTDPVSICWHLVTLEAFEKQVRKSQIDSARLVTPECAGWAEEGFLEP